MTSALDATVQTIVRTSQFARSDVESAIDALRADPDNEAPLFTPWTDEQLAARLPMLAEMAARGGASLPYAARALREAEAAGAKWDGGPS